MDEVARRYDANVSSTSRIVEIDPSSSVPLHEQVAAAIRRAIHLAGPDTQATAVPSSAAFLLSVTAWSPDSSWLFYQGPGQRMWAYQATTGQARSSAITCCQYAVMVTTSSPPG